MERDVFFRKSNWQVIGFTQLLSFFSSHCQHILLIGRIRYQVLCCIIFYQQILDSVYRTLFYHFHHLIKDEQYKRKFSEGITQKYALNITKSIPVHYQRLQTNETISKHLQDSCYAKYSNNYLKCPHKFHVRILFIQYM